MNGQALSVVALRSIGTFDLNILMTSNQTVSRGFLQAGAEGFEPSTNTTYHPLNVDFIGFSALLYDKTRGPNLGLCRQSVSPGW